jgi:hypothetical protein
MSKSQQPPGPDIDRPQIECHEWWGELHCWEYGNEEDTMIVFKPSEECDCETEVKQ